MDYNFFITNPNSKKDLNILNSNSNMFFTSLKITFGGENIRFNKAILILALFAVILSAAAVSATDGAGDVIADKLTDSTEGEDIDVSGSVNLTNSLDVDDDETDDDEDLDDSDDEELDDNQTTYGGDLDIAYSSYSPDEKNPNETAVNKENNDKVSVDSTATGNPLIVLLASMAIIGTGFIRTRK
jgi:hypothetical protein